MKVICFSQLLVFPGSERPPVSGYHRIIADLGPTRQPDARGDAASSAARPKYKKRVWPLQSQLEHLLHDDRGLTPAGSGPVIVGSASNLDVAGRVIERAGSSVASCDFEKDAIGASIACSPVNM